MLVNLCNIKETIHAYKWRKLWRIMHDIRDDVENDAPPASFMGIKYNNESAHVRKVRTIGKMMYEMGPSRKMAEIASDMADALYCAVVENNDDDMPDKWDEISATAKFKFLQRTTYKMRQKYQAKRGGGNALRSVLYKRYTPYEDGQAINATFRPNKKSITFFGSQVETDFDDAIDTIAHEYTHALQHIGKTQIVGDLLTFVDIHWDRCCTLPSHQQPEEIEADYMADAVLELFREQLIEYRDQKYLSR